MRTKDGDVFECGQELVDVTSSHRVDASWLKVDANGHEHRWYTDGQPAKAYRSSANYDTPTLVWVKDGEAMYEYDDEPHDVGHLECRQCGEHVTPAFTADSHARHIGGLRWYRINGEPVSPEEFERRYMERKP